MARIRTIKPDFWTDDKIVGLSPMARLLFIGMWNFADDHGGIERSASQLKMKIFPGDTVDVEPLVHELLRSGLVAEYEALNVVYLHIVNFLRHQRINRPSTPRIPAFKEGVHRKLPDDSMRTHGGLNEDSVTEGKGSGSGRNLERKGSGRDKDRRGARGEPTPESKSSSVPDSQERTTSAQEKTAGGNGKASGKMNTFTDANKIKDPETRAITDRMLRRVGPT